MNSSSPANSSISTTAIDGGGGGANATNAALEDFHFPCDLISIQYRKDEAPCLVINKTLIAFTFAVLKSDLMYALNEEVKSLDEDNWSLKV
ncbi:hypothetical protein REPUB_Repub08aG0227100 [Reevesia pubescens]